MNRVAFAHLRAHFPRFVAVSLAVVLSVAFMSAVLILSESSKATLRASIGEEFSTADLVLVRDDPYTSAEQEFTATELERDLAAVPGVAAAYSPEFLVTTIRAGAVTQFAAVGSLPPEEFRTFELTDGRLPGGIDEAVMSQSVAQQFGFSVGDIVSVDPTADQYADYVPEGDAPGAENPSRALTLVGLTSASNDPRTAYRLTLTTTQETADALAASGEQRPVGGQVYAMLTVDAGADRDQVAAAVDAAATDSGVKNMVVLSADEYVREMVTSMAGGTDILTLMLFAFVAIAIFVSALVIANTFSVLVAQRARELALLRCVGATTHQIRSSVLLEAFLMSLVASVLGVLAAFGLMYGLVAIASESDARSTLGVFAFDWTAIVLPVVTGVAMTLVASLGPAREATRVSPLAAMRQGDGIASNAGAGRARLIVGIVLLVVGLTALTVASFANLGIGAFGIALAGALVSAVGIILLTVFVVPRLVGMIGRIVSGSVPGKLAALNSVRNPRRTAATATALIIGVTLVSTIYTGAAVTRATLDTALDAKYPVDIAVTTGYGEPLSQDVRDEIRALDGVSAATPFAQTGIAESTDGALIEVWAVDPAAFSAIARVDASGLDEDTALVSTDIRSDSVTFSLAVPVEPTGAGQQAEPGVSAPLDLGVIHNGAPAGVAVIATSRFEDAIGQASQAGAQGMLVRIDDSLDAGGVNALRTEILSLAPTASVSGAALERAMYDEIIQTLLLIVTGLLAVAVVIAVIGVSNTLSLSVIERVRENALLRALGLTRGQLRATLAYEAVLLSVTAAVLGVVLGVFYGNLGARTIVSEIGEVAVAVDWLTLGVILVVAVVAGLCAAVLPARRATKLSPVQGLATA